MDLFGRDRPFIVGGRYTHLAPSEVPNIVGHTHTHRTITDQFLTFNLFNGRLVSRTRTEWNKRNESLQFAVICKRRILPIPFERPFFLYLWPYSIFSLPEMIIIIMNDAVYSGTTTDGNLQYSEETVLILEDNMRVKFIKSYNINHREKCNQK